jgi:hypothetical protein
MVGCLAVLLVAAGVLWLWEWVFRYDRYDEQ